MNVVVFPELSLTGYTPERAAQLAIDVNDPIIARLSRIAQQHNVIMISGCPLKNGELMPFIGAIISFPSGSTDFYRKQHLHGGGEDHFSSGDVGYTFTLKNLKIALAICADFSCSAHVMQAKEDNADVYLASVLISDGGFEKDRDLLQSYAKNHHISVLMSNHNGITGDWKGCGKSRAWHRGGGLSVASDTDDKALVVCNIVGSSVSGQVVKLS